MARDHVIAVGSRRVSEWYSQLVTPALSGLPTWRVVVWFPALVMLGVAVLVILNLSGSSSGVHWFNLGEGVDPRLLFGAPRPIRSDEWLVQQSWVVSQANSGYPGENQTFPGGTDMTVLSELPNWDWSSLFRPHLWGYLLFGLDAGLAWHWWIPALLLVVGCYLFVVTLLPRRPLTAAFFAIAIYFTPLLQWFYSPSSLLPSAWALLAMAGTMWIIVDRRRWVRWTWCAVVGYFAVTMAMSLYLPFILPGVFVFLAFGIGYALRARVWAEIGARGFALRISPFLVAGVAAGAITLIWILTRLATFSSIQSTVYPGQRQLATGNVLTDDPYLAGLAGAPWAQALKAQGSSILGGNASEGSSVVLVAFFLLPGLLWFAIPTLRRRVRADWLLVCCIAVFLLFAAYMFIPGWDAIAHVLQLDRVAPERLRIVFVVLTPLFAGLVIDHIDKHPEVKHWRPALASGVLVTVCMAALYLVIRDVDPKVLGMAPTWKITVPLVILAIVLFYFRRAVPLAAFALLLVALILTVNVNPVYRGLFDLSKTDVGQKVMELDEANDGWWLGIGSYETQAILTQTGVGSFSGVQNYPSKEMWQEIDPDGDYEQYWNRLAHIHWDLGKGEPTVSNPYPDVVTVTFDPCSDFAQQYVNFVLSDAGDIEGDCLRLVSDIPQGSLDMRIYEVVPER